MNNGAKIFVVSGGPGTGKTCTLNELQKDFRIIPESARAVAESDPRFIGKSIKEINQKDFQEAIFNYERKQFKSVKDEEIVFSDRGLGDTLAYREIHKLGIPKRMLDFAMKFRYSAIFMLDPLKNYEQDSLRMETKEEADAIHAKITKMYEELGYRIIMVPVLSVKERAKFIRAKINSKK